MRILVAEDNAVNRLFVSRTLEKRGQQVVAVADGEAAVAAHAREAFDAILMDIEMPVLDGIEATKAIRKAEAATGKHVTIIALTAHENDRERCLAAGMDEYLTKPVVPEQMFAVLDRNVS